MRSPRIVAITLAGLVGVWEANADASDSGLPVAPASQEHAGAEGDTGAALPLDAAPPIVPTSSAAAMAQPSAVAPMPPEGVPSRTALTHADVHLYADYEGAWLELKSAVDPGPWQRVCQAPCDARLRVEGMLARVTAPGMTPSNDFRIEPGAGTAQLKVAGGSATARGAGLATLIAGIPVTLAGMGVFGYGSVRDNDGLRTAGAVTLGVGAIAVLTALPLLLAGSTSVRDGRGHFVATGPATFTTR